MNQGAYRTPAEIKALRGLFRAAELYVGRKLTDPFAKSVVHGGDHGELLRGAALEYAAAVRAEKRKDKMLRDGGHMKKRNGLHPSGESR